MRVVASAVVLRFVIWNGTRIRYEASLMAGSSTSIEHDVNAQKLKFKKIIETCIYSTDLNAMKDFYVNRLGLDLVSEEGGRHVFLKAGKSMLLIFNPENTRLAANSIFPVHGARTPPSSIHFALEIEQVDYEAAKNVLMQNKIPIEKEMSWGSGGRSIYFRDPVGNLVEIVTKGQWPVQD